MPSDENKLRVEPQLLKRKASHEEHKQPSTSTQYTLDSDDGFGRSSINPLRSSTNSFTAKSFVEEDKNSSFRKVRSSEYHQNKLPIKQYESDTQNKPSLTTLPTYSDHETDEMTNSGDSANEEPDATACCPCFGSLFYKDSQKSSN